MAGTAVVLVAVSVWGGVGVVVRFVEGIDGLVIGFHRLWIGALVTLAAFYATGGRLTWRTLRLSVPGGVAFACDIVLFFSALKHTTVANATVVGALQPALVLVVAGPLFGERITKALVAATVVAVGGVALVVYGSADEAVWSPLGDLLAVGALFAWTSYFVASRQVRQRAGLVRVPRRHDRRRDRRRSRRWRCSRASGSIRVAWGSGRGSCCWRSVRVASATCS